MRDVRPETRQAVDTAVKRLEGRLDVLIDAVLQLPDEHLNEVMKKVGQHCVPIFVRDAQIPLDDGLDTFLEHMANKAGPVKRRIEVIGDTIYWEYLGDGWCTCPFVRYSLVKPGPRWCICGVHNVKAMLEKVTGYPVETSLEWCILDGHSQTCLTKSVIHRTIITAPARRG